MADSGHEPLAKIAIVRLPSEMHQQLVEIAEREDRTISQTIRRAIKRYLLEEEGTP